LRLLLQVKAFPPLTSEVESQQQPQQKKQVGGVVTIHATHTKDASYWDWPGVDNVEEEKAQIIDQIMQEEKARVLLSAARIEANLVQTNAEAKMDTISAESVDEEYWYDGNDERVTMDRPATAQSYWDWPTRTPQEVKQAAIDDIMEDERVRQLLAATHIVENIVRHSANATVTSKPSPESMKYWDWSIPQDNGYWNWPSTQEEEKKLIIQNILNEERSRQQFSIQHIEANMRREFDMQKPTQLMASAGAESSYWDW
jgi:hypothetical protein